MTDTPNEQRVIEEHKQLNERIISLRNFLETSLFKTLPEAEQIRMRVQAEFMRGYRSMLKERIIAFLKEEKAVFDEAAIYSEPRPRVTPEHIDALITEEQYYVFPNVNLTVCCLTLKNGFVVIGESGCIDRENFDPELGRKLALVAARDRVWEMEIRAAKRLMKA